jgi:hypothetical protein
MTDQVVDADDRQISRERQAERGLRADVQRAGQTGPRRHRDAVEPGQRNPGLLERGLDHRAHVLQMIA